MLLVLIGSIAAAASELQERGAAADHGYDIQRLEAALKVSNEQLASLKEQLAMAKELSSVKESAMAKEIAAMKESSAKDIAAVKESSAKDKEFMEHRISQLEKGSSMQVAVPAGAEAPMTHRRLQASERTGGLEFAPEGMDDSFVRPRVYTDETGAMYLSTSGDINLLANGTVTSINALVTSINALASRLVEVETTMFTQAAADAMFSGSIEASDFVIDRNVQTFRSGGTGSLSNAINGMLCLAMFQGMGYSIPSDGFSFGYWGHLPRGCSIQNSVYPHYNTNPNAPESVSGWTNIPGF